MLNHYLPRVGDDGFYSFKEPFDSNEIYRLNCQVVSTMEQLEKNYDIKTLAFIDNGLDESHYILEKEVNSKIAILTKSDGNDIFIPVSYFKSFVKTNIVEYKEVILGVNLGLLPKTVEVDHLLDQFKAIAGELVGKDSEGFIVETDNQSLISYEQHMELETVRQSNINADNNPYKKIAELESLLEEYRIREEAYQQYVTARESE